MTTLTTFAGLLLGIFVTLSSVGAGAIGMTALVLLYPRTPIARLVGSDIAHAVPLTLIAGVGHWLLDRSIGYCWVRSSVALCPASSSAAI